MGNSIAPASMMETSVRHLPVWDFLGNQNGSTKESKVVSHTNTIPLQLQSKQTFRTGSSAVRAHLRHVRPRPRPGRGGRPHHATVACVAPPAADSSAVREVKGAHTHATCNATSSVQKVQPARHCSHVFTSRLPDPSHAATLIVDSLRTNRTMT